MFAKNILLLLATFGYFLQHFGNIWQHLATFGNIWQHLATPSILLN